MDLFAYMLGKQAGGGGGGNAEYYPIIDGDLAAVLAEETGSYSVSGAVEFVMYWEGEPYNSLFGTPGDTITLNALQGLDELTVATWTHYTLNDIEDNNIIHEFGVAEGAEFTFTMPDEAVYFSAIPS